MVDSLTSECDISYRQLILQNSDFRDNITANRYYTCLKPLLLLVLTFPCGAVQWRKHWVFRNHTAIWLGHKYIQKYHVPSSNNYISDQWSSEHRKSKIWLKGEVVSSCTRVGQLNATWNYSLIIHPVPGTSQNIYISLIDQTNLFRPYSDGIGSTAPQESIGELKTLGLDRKSVV